MADYAYDKYELVGDKKIYTKPPPELLIAFDWLKFRTPPRAGGLRNQPLLLMHRIKAAINTYDIVKAYRSASKLSPKAFADWQGQNVRAMNFLIKYVWKMDEDNGE